MTKKVLIIGGYAPSLLNFRGALIRHLCEQGHEVLACAPDPSPEIERGLAQIGARCVAVPMNRTGLNPFADLRYLLRLVALMRTHRPDVVLSYTVKPLIWGSLAARIAGVPRRYALITGLGYAFGRETAKQRLVGGVVGLLYRAAMSACQRVAFQNPDNQETFQKLKIVSADKTVVVNGSGVDVAHYGFHRPLPERCTFLLIARLLKDKGILEYAEAARQIRKRYSNVRFLLVGAHDINPMALTADERDACVTRGGLEYLGEVADVRHAIRECSVYVLPSYAEGMPRTVLEAMSMGRAIVTTDAPGCRQTVVPGENGLLVPVRDASALSDAMCRFLEEPHLVEIMGKNSRALAERSYDVKLVNQQMLNMMGLA